MGDRPGLEEARGPAIARLAGPPSPPGPEQAEVAPGAATARAWVPSLQSLRGIAALGVVLYHLDAQIVSRGFDFLPVPGARQGWVGVDLFFVLSAYLLGQPFLQRRAPGYRAFFTDRFLRIAPAYYVAFAFSVAVVAALAHPGWDPLAALASLAFLHNFRLDTLNAVNPPFWSIAVEMQFYLLLPLMARAFRTRGWPAALVACVAASLVFRAVIYGRLSEEANIVSWFTLPAYLGHFGLGLAAARIVRLSGKAASLRLPLLLVGLATIAAALWAWYPFPALTFERVSFGPQVFIRPALAAGFAAVVLVVASGGRLSQALAWRPLAWLGAASYSIYLVHYPVLLLAMRALDHGLPLIGAEVAAVTGALVIGGALHSGVEAPAERWRRRRKHRLAQTGTLPEPLPHGPT